MGEISDYHVEQFAAGRWGMSIKDDPAFATPAYLPARIRKDPNRNHKRVEEVVMSNNVQVNGMPTFVVVVEFLKSSSAYLRHYDFFCNVPVEEGSIVVVDTVNGLQLAEVVGVKKHSGKAGKWVVDVVDTKAFKLRQEAEKRRKELKRKMDARAKKMDEMERFRQIAKNDPEMAKLLQQYHEAEAKLSGFTWDVSGEIDLTQIPTQNSPKEYRIVNQGDGMHVSYTGYQRSSDGGKTWENISYEEYVNKK